MQSTNTPAYLVARFLRANNFDATLDVFIAEAGLEPNTGLLEKNSLTIEKILEEKKTFDVSLQFEKLGTENDDRSWKLPAPSKPMLVTNLPAFSNLLHVSINNLQSRLADGTLETWPVIITSAADRRLNLFSIIPGFPFLKTYPILQDSPILSCLILGGGSVSITTSMSGQVVLHDHAADKTLTKRHDHKKYVVKAAALEVANGAWLATAGWDARVLLYHLDKSSAGAYETIGSPIAQVELPTNPETVAFVKSPQSSFHVLIVTRRDSTSLHYYGLPPVPSNVLDQSSTRLKHLGSQNLAPHSMNAWVSFSPSSISICPTDPAILAVATSAVPHMKLIIVRLLFPSVGANITPPTHIPQTRAELALQEQEDSAVLIHSSTFAPQSRYSTPHLAWRPDGSGVWVNGDDGILRGIEAKTGKLIATLKGGHDPGSRIRSIWAGWVDGAEGREEWVISGGFDKRLVIWKPMDDTI